METLSDLPAVQIGGLPFSVTDMDKAVSLAISAAKSTTSPRSGLPVRLSNAYCVALASSVPAYADLFHAGGVTLPDGAPVVWVMQRALRGSSLKAGRVRGPSFFREVMDRGRQQGLRHYFLGATESTLTDMTNRIRLLYPGVAIAGYHAPAFGPVDDAWVAQAMKHLDGVQADIIWVALGTPKQDYAAAQLASRTGLMCIGVGAAFDFVAGSIPEAPPIIQRFGMEWIFRLLSEPRRLWRRYVFGNSRFIWSVVDRGSLKRQR